MLLIRPAVTEKDRIANSEYAMTLEEIGTHLGLTRERVRQIEKQALDKLRVNFPATLFLMRELADDLRESREQRSVIAEHRYGFGRIG